MLYTLVAETLGNLIRQNNKIIGLPLAGSSEIAKISQYGDNTTVIVTNESSVLETFHSIKIFESGSGSKVKLASGKSEAKGSGKFSSYVALLFLN